MKKNSHPIDLCKINLNRLIRNHGDKGFAIVSACRDENKYPDWNNAEKTEELREAYRHRFETFIANPCERQEYIDKYKVKWDSYISGNNYKDFKIFYLQNKTNRQLIREISQLFIADIESTCNMLSSLGIKYFCSKEHGFQGSYRQSCRNEIGIDLD